LNIFDLTNKSIFRKNNDKGIYNMKVIKLISMLVFLIWIYPPLAVAQELLKSGTYVSANGLYSIELESTSEGIIVVEPNQKSLYTPSGAKNFQYTSSRNILYGIYVHSDFEIETYKPGFNGPGTNGDGDRFRLRTAPVINESPDVLFSDIAEKYFEMAQDYPADVLLWTSCASVAYARGNFDDKSAEEFIERTVATLKIMMEGKRTNPCPDAIPSSAW